MGIHQIATGGANDLFIAPDKTVSQQSSGGRVVGIAQVGGHDAVEPLANGLLGRLGLLVLDHRLDRQLADSLLAGVAIFAGLFNGNDDGVNGGFVNSPRLASCG